MKKRLAGILIVYITILTVVTGVLHYSGWKDDKVLQYQNAKVDLNEMIQLSKACGKEEAKLQNSQIIAQGIQEAENTSSGEQLEEAVSEFEKNLNQSSGIVGDNWEGYPELILYGFCILFLLFIFFYIYIKIIRPFEKMEKYAAEIAKGNLQVTLPYERTNYFGAFTWAFDHMRKEIGKARTCEKEAIENNKTVIATLSHDIKTPIASIRAYAEALDANLDVNQEKRRQYSMVIMKKCDEVTKLTNDLFLHSLSDLNKLKMNIEEVRIKELLEEILDGLQSEGKDIQIFGEIPDVVVKTDKRRFEQVIENLVNNVRKYAEGMITINVTVVEDKLQIRVRDYGKGIADEDIPFVFNKFYRGKNIGEQQGSGLGLYIVKYIMEQTGGSVSLRNTENGLEVVLLTELN